MTIDCIWEHNGSDTLLYSVDFVGAYARGKSLAEAEAKMADEIESYARWCGVYATRVRSIRVIQEQCSELNISDADSDVIFDKEKAPLSLDEYTNLKKLALKSAEDFLLLYGSIGDKAAALSPRRKTFYGFVPRTAEEMYLHTKGVNEYYFGEIRVAADNEGSILDSRLRGFLKLEQSDGFLARGLIEGSFGELWSLRKLLRRFIWHDRIHARAMWRLAQKAFPCDNIANPYCFSR